MSLDSHTIQLSGDQQLMLSDLSDATGKPWPVVLDEALRAYGAGKAKTTSGNGADSFATVARRLGLLGCVAGGPPDLSTNPAYMEGFGRSDD